jgi:hypothetical protein
MWSPPCLFGRPMFQLLNKLTDIYENWWERYAIGGNYKVAVFIFHKSKVKLSVCLIS